MNNLFMKIQNFAQRNEYLFAGLLSVTFLFIFSIFYWFLLQFEMGGVMLLIFLSFAFFMPTGIILENLGINLGLNYIVFLSIIFWVIFFFVLGMLVYKIYLIVKNEK